MVASDSVTAPSTLTTPARAPVSVAATSSTWQDFPATPLLPMVVSDSVTAPSTLTSPVCAPGSVAASSKWQGFKIVGDNIDKNVRRRHQRADRTTVSLHYFNAFAVGDRVDFSSFSEKKPDISFNESLVESLLPSKADLHELLANFKVLVSRILVEHLPLLSKLSSVVTKHITHKYSTEMALKSEVVSTIIFVCDICVLTKYMFSIH